MKCSFEAGGSEEGLQLTTVVNFSLETMNNKKGSRKKKSQRTGRALVKSFRRWPRPSLQLYWVSALVTEFRANYCRKAQNEYIITGLLLLCQSDLCYLRYISKFMHNSCLRAFVVQSRHLLQGMVAGFGGDWI